jgi:hypothetical protein
MPTLILLDELPPFLVSLAGGTTAVGAYPVSSPRILRQWLIPPTEPDPELVHADPTQIDARQERKCASEMN